jgi:thiol-disulfide isomerase/thioredoxin
MKKMTKFMSVLLVVAMLLTMVGCGSQKDPSTAASAPNATHSTPNSNTGDSKVPYVVKVQSVGGLPLEKVDVMIFDGENMVQAGSTNAEGIYTVNMKPGKTYTIQLNAVPAGYTAEASYSFDGTSCVISLTSTLITGENISGHQFVPGDIMYDFEFEDTDGKIHKLSETLAEKKMVMLNFWNKDCSWCQKEFPAIDNVYSDYKDNVEIFALDDAIYDTMDDVRQWKNNLNDGLDFPMGLIRNGLGITSFGCNGRPLTVIVDRYGMIAMAHPGAITSEYVWKQIFTYFTADDYKQKLITDYNDIVSQEKPTTVFPGNDVIGGIINQGDINITYYPSNEQTDPDAYEYMWPFVEATVGGVSCIKASNNRVDSSYAILYADVVLEAGQAIGFDYLISSEQGMDIAIIVVDGNDIYQMSGYDAEQQQWKTCYPWVAEEAGTYQLAICYAKDGTNNVGDDTIYINNMRVVDVDDIDVDTYIPRQAATLNEKGEYEYAKVFYNEKDGYYHVGSENGPLLLANLMGYTVLSSENSIYLMALDGEIKKNGHDYVDDLTKFASYASNALLTGYCTVNQELAELLKIVADVKGFDGTEDEWLKCCEYYQTYGPSGMQMEDPIKGLSPFSAPNAILGKWVKNENGELVFQGANGETGDYNCFTYDRPIVPRGKFFRFTPTVSGAYRITSRATSSFAPDAWLFTEQGFYEREPLYTYAAEERFYDFEGNNISMVYYMEVGKTYFIDIAFWDVYEAGIIPFDLEFLGEEYDLFRKASPGPFTYLEGSEYIIPGGIGVALGDDGVYYHVVDKDGDGEGDRDENGKPILGSKLYADFTQFTTCFTNKSILQMIEMGAFDFTKNEEDDEILFYLRQNNNDVEATKEFLRNYWGVDYEVYARDYKIDEIFSGKFHGTGVDKTEEIKAFISQMIDAEGQLEDGCVVVTEELAVLLQMLMDKFIFKDVEYSWLKLCYYFDYMGR